MKKCVFCRQQIANDATVCQHCRNTQSVKSVDPNESAERVIKLVETMVKWIGIPLTIAAAVIAFFGIHQLSDLKKAASEAKDVAAILKASQDSVLLTLTSTANLQAQMLLSLYSMDSDAAEFQAGIETLSKTIEMIDKLTILSGVRDTEKYTSVARGLVAYRKGNYREVIDKVRDPPQPDGVWQQHLLAAAYYKLGDHEKELEHDAKFVSFAKGMSSPSRAEQNYWVTYALSGKPGALDKGISNMQQLLVSDPRPVGIANLAGLLAKRAKNDDVSQAAKTLDSAIEHGLCKTVEALEKDDEIGSIVRDNRDHYAELLRKRGPC